MQMKTTVLAKTLNTKLVRTGPGKLYLIHNELLYSVPPKREQEVAAYLQPEAKELQTLTDGIVTSDFQYFEDFVLAELTNLGRAADMVWAKALVRA
jgi:hypothetical protein